MGSCFAASATKPRAGASRGKPTDTAATLRAPVLPARLQAVEAEGLPRAEVKIEALRRLMDPCRQVPERRGAKG